MKNHRVSREEKIDYSKLSEIFSSYKEKIVFCQYLYQGDLIWPSPCIFIGTFEYFNSSKNELLVRGVGGIKDMFTGENHIPLEKNLGLARIVNEKRQIIFEHKELAKSWEEYYVELIKQAHKKPKDSEIKKWLDAGQTSCFQFHSLMDVYLPRE